MKFSKLIEYNKKNILETVSAFFLFFKKDLFEVNASGLQLSFNIFQ